MGRLYIAIIFAVVVIIGIIMYIIINNVNDSKDRKKVARYFFSEGLATIIHPRRYGGLWHHRALSDELNDRSELPGYDSDELEGNIINKKNAKTQPAPKSDWICENCKHKNAGYVGTCACGKRHYI